MYSKIAVLASGRVRNDSRTISRDGARIRCYDTAIVTDSQLARSDVRIRQQVNAEKMGKRARRPRPSSLAPPPSPSCATDAPWRRRGSGGAGATTDSPATSELWVYDFRTNQHFTLKTKQLTRPDLDNFVDRYKPGRRHERTEAENFKRWSYDEIALRPGFNHDIWADDRDESLEDAASLPAPAVIAEEIVANLTTGLEQFAAVAAELNGDGGRVARD
jgi:hypothetical protein